MEPGEAQDQGSKPLLIQVCVMVLLFIGGLVWAFNVQIEHWIAENEQAFTRFIEDRVLQQDWLLIPAAFLGGLIASLSPCILALLPANLSYIGTLNPESKQAAVRNASLFMLGIAGVLSLFGLVASFAGAVVVDYKGHVHIAVGVMSMIFALGLLGAFKIRVPAGVSELPKGAGPFLVGTTFALVTSPCASPVLFTLLSAAGTSGNTALAVLTMIAYAVGYSAVVFISSLITGFVRQVGKVKRYAAELNRVAASFLLLVGLYYVIVGILWFTSQ